MTATRKTKKQKALLAIATKLREARDLMNHGGKHWIKGAEKQFVTETHEPGDYGLNPSYYNRNDYEYGFCSIGALKETDAEDEAFLTLARVIDPVGMRMALKDAAEYANDEAKYHGEYGEYFDIEECICDQVRDAAENIIMLFNDGGMTTWPDVRSAFTKAAKRIADRARKAS